MLVSSDSEYCIHSNFHGLKLSRFLGLEATRENFMLVIILVKLLCNDQDGHQRNRSHQEALSHLHSFL